MTDLTKCSFTAISDIALLFKYLGAHLDFAINYTHSFYPVLSNLLTLLPCCTF